MLHPEHQSHHLFHHELLPHHDPQASLNCSLSSSFTNQPHQFHSINSDNFILKAHSTNYSILNPTLNIFSINSNNFILKANSTNYSILNPTSTTSLYIISNNFILNPNPTKNVS